MANRSLSIFHSYCVKYRLLLSLREFQSCFSALMDSFLFRERLRPSSPPIFFLPGTCEEKTAGQRIWAAGNKRAHVGSMPACLAITTERVFAWPLHPTWSASLCGCERHDLVRCEWQCIGWQPFSGSFRHGRVIGLCDWPHPLAVICFTQRQTQSVWRAHPRYDEGCQRARARMVSASGAISQQAGRVVSSGAPSGPPPMLIPLLPWSTRRAHKIVVRPLLVLHPSFCFSCSHIGWRRWRKLYKNLPPLDESVAAHLCPPTAIG